MYMWNVYKSCFCMRRWAFELVHVELVHVYSVALIQVLNVNHGHIDWLYNISGGCNMFNSVCTFTGQQMLSF